MMKAMDPLVAKQKSPPVAAIDLVLKEFSSADADKRTELADILARLVVPPGGEIPRAVIDPVAAALQSETDEKRRISLAQSLRILTPNASPDEVSAVATLVGVAKGLGVLAADTAEPDIRRTVELLASLAEKGDQTIIARTISVITAATRREKEDQTILVNTLSALAGTDRYPTVLFAAPLADRPTLMSNQTASQALELFMATPDVNLRRLLAIVIDRVARSVDPDLAAGAARKLAQAFPNPDGSPASWSLPPRWHLFFPPCQHKRLALAPI